MNWTRHRYEIAAAVPVLAVFGALYVWSIPSDGNTSLLGYMFWYGVVFAIPTFFWLVASLLLVNQWWGGASARLSMMDTPGQVLVAAVATLPEPRRRWGEAMLGELAQVQGRSARWRFALSCVRAALSLPVPTRWPVAAIAAGVVVAVVPATHRLVGAAVPGLGLFAASFVALVGALVVLAIARGRRMNLRVPAATVLVTGAVAAAVAATAAFLVRHPTAAGALSDRGVVLAVALAGCLWLAAALPGWMGSGRLAPYLGVGTAVLYASVLLAASRADASSAALLFAAPVLIFAVPAVIAAAVSRSCRAGVHAGIWTAIATMPLVLAQGLYEASRSYAVTGVWTFAGDVVDAGFTFGFIFLTFLAIPIIGFPFAVLAAIAGAALPRRTPKRTGAGVDVTGAAERPEPVE
jgi:hypothetical protein